MAEWAEIPTTMFQHLAESLRRRVEAGIEAELGSNSILLPLALKWDVHWIHRAESVTLGHIVYPKQTEK